MAVNQPPISDDPTTSAWMLEVTRELNELRNREQRLTEQIATMMGMTTAPPATEDTDAFTAAAVRDATAPINERGSLVLTRRDVTDRPFTYDLASAISLVPTIFTQSVKAEVINTRSFSFTDQPPGSVVNLFTNDQGAETDVEANSAHIFAAFENNVDYLFATIVRPAFGVINTNTLAAPPAAGTGVNQTGTLRFTINNNRLRLTLGHTTGNRTISGSIITIHNAASL